MLVQGVDEAVAERQRPVGQLLLAQRADKPVDAVQHLQPLLDRVGLQAQGAGHDGPVELEPLDAGGRQQPPVGLVEPVDLAADQAADRLGQVAGQVGDRADEGPAALLARDDAPVAEVAQEVHQEQRAALGLGVDQGDEVGREAVLGEGGGQVAA